MRSHIERAKIMYRDSTKPQEVATASPATGREVAAKALYGESKSVHVGSIANAVASAFDRIESGVLDDKERLAQVQRDRRTAKSLLEKANATPADAHTLVSAYREARSLNRSKEANEKIWQGPHGFDQLRRDAGSTEAAVKKIAQTEALVKQVEKENPGFAYELRTSGACQDLRFIEAAANIHDGIAKHQSHE